MDAPRRGITPSKGKFGGAEEGVEREWRNRVPLKTGDTMQKKGITRGES